MRPTTYTIVCTEPKNSNTSMNSKGMIAELVYICPLSQLKCPKLGWPRKK